MDSWYFEENLSQRDILERAAKEFGIKASQQTLTSYFRHRERMLNLPDGLRELEPDEEHALETRVGAGMNWDNLEAKTLHFAVMAAYEMSLAEPEKMRVKEIRSLMKMLNEHQRRMLDGEMRQRKLDLQRIALEAKIKKDFSGRQTNEEFEKMVMETADMLNRVRRKDAENWAELQAEMEKREAETRDNVLEEAAEDIQTQEDPGDGQVEPREEANGEVEK